MPSLCLEHCSINNVTNNPRQEEYEGIHNTLNKCKGHHVAIVDVGEFMAEDAIDFFRAHVVEQARRDRHQGAVFGRAGGTPAATGGG